MMEPKEEIPFSRCSILSLRLQAVETTEDDALEKAGGADALKKAEEAYMFSLHKSIFRVLLTSIVFLGLIYCRVPNCFTKT